MKLAKCLKEIQVPITLDQLKVWNWELYYLNDDRTSMNIYPN